MRHSHKALQLSNWQSHMLSEYSYSTNFQWMLGHLILKLRKTILVFRGLVSLQQPLEEL